MSSTPTTTRLKWSRRLGEELVARGNLPPDRLEEMLARGQATSRPLASVVVADGMAEPAVVLSTLSALSGMTPIDLYRDHPAADAVRSVPGELSRELTAIGWRFDGPRLVMAFAEPPGPEEIRALETALDRQVAPVLADASAVERIIGAAFPQSSPPSTGAPAQNAVRGLEEGVEWTRPPSGAPDEGLLHEQAPGQVATEPATVREVSPPGNFQFPDDASALDIDDLLRVAVQLGSSDLHLAAGSAPSVRIDGSIRRLEGAPVLDGNVIREMIFGILPQAMRERFEATRELDASHSIIGVGRFRVNVFVQRDAVGAVLRAIPHDIPALEELGLPEVIRSFTDLQRGLVLVTGPTGSGKSTTLASLIDIINRSRPVHIMTVEDPIEFTHSHQRSIVNQREVGQDTMSFAEALKHVLRQDPDVILVGEMRDLETISTALTAAETGHLVFATLHTQDAPQTIDRIIDVFPTNQQAQVRVQLSTTLVAVVTQQLLLRADGAGRVAAAEVMVATPAIRNLIRESKTHQIPSLMQAGAKFGMQSMDQALASLVTARTITEAYAVSRCHSEDELRRYLAST